MEQQLGLRERKKQQTRRLLADTARSLFAEHGFQDVTVAEVASAADVSEATVFNYFPTKEDLLLSGLEVFEEALLGAVRERAAGESVLAAFGDFVLTSGGLLAETEPSARQRLTAISRVIEESPTLLEREQTIFAGYTDSLAAVIAEEVEATSDDRTPWVVANALMGVHRATVSYARRQILDGVRSPTLVRRVRAQARRALAVLASGLGDYAVKGA